jgi:hypothetical protein
MVEKNRACAVPSGAAKEAIDGWNACCARAGVQTAEYRLAQRGLPF